MPPEVLQLFAQLGASGILLWLLLEERKARQALEARVFKYLEDEREDAREATRPKPPVGLISGA